MTIIFRAILVWMLTAGVGFPAPAQARSGTTYYVSSSTGLDGNDGLSAGSPFATINKVNSLALQAGDTVLFRCGDTWRGQILRVTHSGSVGAPITYSSYPGSSCPDKPIFSGAQPVSGWSVYSGSVYVADLSAQLFPSGVNQVFRDGQRLGIGRWPNIGSSNGGYASIDSQPTSLTFVDGQLPAGDWSGAAVHIKGMRWYLLNRRVVSDSGSTLTVNSNLDCWDGCAGWGYWLDSHLSTLDQDGEWFYQSTTRKLYLFSNSNPSGFLIEASVVINGESQFMGGIILGRHLYEHVSNIVIENLEISKWFDHGITTPVNLERDENANIVIQNNLIRDVDGAGINLMTWVWNAEANGNGYNGWRGGRNIQILGNVIDTANRFGINSYARQSIIADNVIRNVGLIANLGQAGMGCEITDGGGSCTEDGDGIRIKVDQDGTYSGNQVILQYNRLERIGYNGVDVFGYSNTIDRNVIAEPCYSKGDCGGLRSFGGDSMADTAVRDLLITNNLILDSIGNTDGAKAEFSDRFGFGLYIDHNSKNVSSSGNSILNATAAGILYQDSTGSVQTNTLFNNASGTMWAYQVALVGAPTWIASFDHNLMLAKQSIAGTLETDNAAKLALSNYNGFYHSSRVNHILAQGSSLSLAGWRSYSGKDADSKEWINGILANAEIFYNDSKVNKIVELTQQYVDLDGNLVPGSTITLAPFTSRILIPIGPLPARLTIRKSAPSWVAEGQSFLYTLEVTNSGGASATNLMLNDDLPSGVIYLGGGELSGNVVQWQFASLEAGATLTATMSVVPAAGVQVIVNNTYSVSAAGGLQANGAPVLTLVDPLHVFLPIISR